MLQTAALAPSRILFNFLHPWLLKLFLLPIRAGFEQTTRKKLMFIMVTMMMKSMRIQTARGEAEGSRCPVVEDV